MFNRSRRVDVEDQRVTDLLHKFNALSARVTMLAVAAEQPLVSIPATTESGDIMIEKSETNYSCNCFSYTTKVLHKHYETVPVADVLAAVLEQCGLKIEMRHTGYVDTF